MAVLVNGSPSSEFRTGRGLRQGDPLSPLLFNLISEALHLILDRACKVGLLKGISLGNGPCLSHILFADDTIILLDSTWNSCRGVRIVLILFEILSGLKVNFQKSKLYSSRGATSIAINFAASVKCEKAD
ncbi:uncharacterized mitochondrial protein AtMg01250-like [Daucus carota subsp. sativus]|uniref:uncharacterized mitochondrial protein AtMg01250-like n=1 Tax=Daucus carota subsp. sativus TaxID=79200 RepID=UPI0007EF1316|nr:PREDICTED: uncharacterized mitochondrial protein AtMg01250-like [Daucus carota subsp. sativus]